MTPELIDNVTLALITAAVLLLVWMLIQRNKR
jgi:hypothetical protein